MSVSDILPISLRCENRLNPLGIDESAPRLSWALDARQRGRRQLAYRILVAGSEEELAAEQHLLWDSGKVASNRSINIVYEGEELRSAARYYWKVRVWDETDQPSAYSEPAMWGMGLLHRADWSGAWIGLGRGATEGVEPPTGEDWEDTVMAQMPRPPYLRTSFQVRGPVREATLYATALGVYELWLNGARVGNAVLAPGWTDYNIRVQYQAYDVTGMLQEGANALGGRLGDGWYAGFFGFDPRRRGAHYGTRPYLLVQLHVTYEDGTTRTISSDGTWKSKAGAILYSDLLIGELYDARQEPEGWSDPGFDDSTWPAASTRELTGPRLVAEPSQPARVLQEIAAKTVSSPAPRVYVFDLGQNIVGWVRLKVSGEAGTRVTMRHAEALNSDGTLYTKNLRSARARDVYILKGSGQEVFEPHFTFHGFRYVEVTGYPGEPPLEAITGCVVHSATPPTGTFECSSSLVNRLQANIVWGQRGNFLSIPTDCPQRDERLGWLGDAQIFVRTACFNMDVSAFFTKWLIDVEDAQSPRGAFPDVAPLLDVSMIDLSEGAPAWGDAGIIIPWTIYTVYGDTRIIERHYDAMERWMAYLREGNPDLLRKRRLNNNFGDWLSPGGDDTPRDLLATAYWAYDARLMAAMTRAIGRRDDAERYEQLFQDIKAAFNRAYVSPDGLIQGNTQTCYVLALHMDLLPDEQRAEAARRLVKAIEQKGWHLSTGFVGVGYLCTVLSEAGYTDVAYRLLTNETFPSWGYTIKHGATTIWERWDGWTEEHGFQSPNMNSFNHYSLGSVGDWLYRYVLGIDQAADTTGYQPIVIHPRPGGGVSWARGEYHSVRGTILSDWRLDGERFTLKVAVPPNTTATVHLPSAEQAQILESGKAVEQVEGVDILHKGQGEVVLAIASGTYEFVSKRA